MVLRLTQIRQSTGGKLGKREENIGATRHLRKQQGMTERCFFFHFILSQVSVLREAAASPVLFEMDFFFVSFLFLFYLHCPVWLSLSRHLRFKRVDQAKLLGIRGSILEPGAANL
jgi:hypothetical protein